ncbi:hypothetical protein [Burkholderia ubonensis]|uniref:hypothetical protein n=1 Tax=Burkholderia ubonensis TaxID=101571 RepID=UPI0012FB08E1|nr:hypothetical protein [Burkholderia ubonensis]
MDMNNAPVTIVPRQCKSQDINIGDWPRITRRWRNAFSPCASGHARLFRPAAGQPHFNADFSALSPGSFESDASFFRTATRFYDFDEA